MQNQLLFVSWYHDPSMRIILPFVVGAHALFMFWAVMAPSSQVVVKPIEKKIVVQTVALQPSLTKSSPRKEVVLNEPLQSISAVEPEPVKMQEKPQEKPVDQPLPMSKTPVAEAAPEKKIEKKSKPEPKKEVQKKAAAPAPKKEQKPIAKKEVPQKKEIKKTEAKPVAQAEKAPKKKVDENPNPKKDPQIEAAKAKQRQLLSKAQENIAKISQSRDKVTSIQAGKVFAAGPMIPGPVESLHIDALPSLELKNLTKGDAGYCDELASRLKLMLRLPEYGAVKVKLTLDRSGQFVKVSVVNAESGANRSYIEKTLPTLRYPSFGDNFSELMQYTFVITLSNDL